jgi:UDP-GlcNAc:undecaprenyl-phosphate GlcNAc-1-phosphate transferase
VLAFAGALGLSLLLTPAVRDFAMRRQMVEGVRSIRHVHTRSVPRLGGIAMVAAFYAVMAVLTLVRPGLGGVPMLALLCGGVCAAALGLADDVRGLRARYKLAAQIAIAGLLCASGFVVRDVLLPGGVEVHLGWFAVPVTVLWITGVMNAVNLIDGLDGLAGGVCTFALAAVFTLAAATAQPGLALAAVTLLGAVLGFLVFNFNPASIFMGDTGSLFLGFFLAVASVSAAQHGTPGLSLSPAPLVLLAVPLLDTSLAIARRAVRGRPLFSPDRDHLHHRLLERTSSQREAVLILYAACALLATAAVTIHVAGGNVARAVTLAVLAAGGLAVHALGIFASGIDTILRDRKRNLGLRQMLDAIALRLQHAAHLNEVIDSMHLLAPALAASRVRVRVGAVVDDRGRPEADELLSMRFLIAEGRRRLGDVEIVWADGRTHVDADHALAIERLCEGAARAVRRVSPEEPSDPGATPPLGLPALGRLARR